MEFTVAIVGLGNIGFLYDKDLPAANHVLTHARAFALHPGFSLVAAGDPNGTLRDVFSATHGVPAYASLEDLLDHARPDVIVLATPTATHPGMVVSILARYSPRAILCEKPLAYEIEAARSMVESCERAGVPLFVNFIRRADPGVLEVKARIEDGRIAMPCKAVVWYSKGFLHNGSHFADLLSFWFGPIKAMSVIASGRAFGDHDAEPDVRLEFEHGSAIFCSAREEDYSHYTVELVTGNGRMRYEQSGEILWQEAVAHPVLPGYRRLDSAGKVIASDMGRYQYWVANQLWSALQGKVHSLCTGSWAVTVQAWLAKAVDTASCRH